MDNDVVVDKDDDGYAICGSKATKSGGVCWIHKGVRLVVVVVNQAA